MISPRFVRILILLLLAAASAGAGPSLTADAAWPQPGQRTAVLVHGINPVHADFDPLSAHLQAEGVAVLRFVYDDRARLKHSARELHMSLAELIRARRPGRLSVIGHSMGGLVARRALTEHFSTAPRVTLVTIASPFAGFHSANWSYLGFGLTPPVWRDLASLGRFIRRPGRLPLNVVHVKVETDERDLKLDGADDCVVKPKRQRRRRVDRRVNRRYVLRLGHVGVLRDAQRAVPSELRAILHRYVLAAEPTGLSGQL